MAYYRCPACGNVGSDGPRCPTCGVTQKEVQGESGDKVTGPRFEWERAGRSLSPFLITVPTAVAVCLLIVRHPLPGTSDAVDPVPAWGVGIFAATLVLSLSELLRVFTRALRVAYERLRWRGLATGTSIAGAKGGMSTVRGRVHVVTPAQSRADRVVCAAYESFVPPAEEAYRLMVRVGRGVLRPGALVAGGHHPQRFRRVSGAGVFTLDDGSGVTARVDAEVVTLFAPIRSNDGEVRIGEGDEVIVRGLCAWSDSEPRQLTFGAREDAPLRIAPVGLAYATGAVRLGQYSEGLFSNRRVTRMFVGLAILIAGALLAVKFLWR